MDLDAKTFAILFLVSSIVGALIWDWFADWWEEFDYTKEDDWWENVDPDDEEIDDESDRSQSGKK